MTDDRGATPAPREGLSRETLTRLIVALVIVVLVLWFALANSQRVEVDYLVGSRDSRLVYVIVGSAILGAIADRLLQFARRRRRR
jgi:uncharacterized integral membrane protein